MRKWVGRVIAVGLILGFGSLGVTATYKGPEVKLKGPEVIKMPTKIKNKESTVIFLHHKHQQIVKGDCGKCHHGKTPDWKKVPYKEGMKIEKCESCHNKNHPKKKLNSAKKAMHKRCMGCHKEFKKEGKKHGPIRKCKDCHKSN